MERHPVEGRNGSGKRTGSEREEVVGTGRYVHF